MKILITGICGFAGSVIARHLLEHSSGLSLVGFDNLSRKGSGTNVDPLRSLGIDVRIGDVRDRAFLDTLPKADWILDCAANPSVLAGVDGSDTRDLVDQNLYGTINLLELCKTWNAGFTLLSTSRVYSIAPLANLPLRETQTRFEPDDKPQEAQTQKLGLDSSLWDPVSLVAKTGISAAGVSETFLTDPPVSLYGSTKRCSELMAHEYGAAFDFPVWINRCGVLAGAGQFGKADQGIFSYWIHSWKKGRPLKYIGFGGTGKQVRDCLHPRDLVPILLRQMIQPQDAQESQNQQIGSEPPLFSPVSPVAKSSFPLIINCSGGISNSMSLLELSAWCQARFGPSHSELHISNSALGETRPFDIPWMVLDSTLAREAWNWQPATPIHDVLEEIALHAEANPDWLDLVT